MTAMNGTITPPTSENVSLAIEKFDSENRDVERGLGELFRLFPGNGDLAHVLLKVSALNGLYSTRIFAVYRVANHIHDDHEEIDSLLACGSPDAVEKIGRVSFPNEEDEGKVRYFYSFATNYCSWHNSDAYPIWDSRADAYLWRLHQQQPFMTHPAKHDHLYDYRKFCEAVREFRRKFSLEEFTFKQIDKFLYESGKAFFA